MAQESVNPEDIFKRIQNSLNEVEVEDSEGDESDEAPIDLPDFSIIKNSSPTENTVKNDSESKAEDKEDDVKEKSDKSKPEESSSTVDKRAGKKYQFTEVSDGKGPRERRISKSQMMQNLQAIPTHNPLLRSEDVSSFTPETAPLDTVLNKAKERNKTLVTKLENNQKAIFKKFLMMNLQTEALAKNSDERLLTVSTQQSTLKMREFEMVEVKLMKYKPHLMYLAQR